MQSSLYTISESIVTERVLGIDRKFIFLAVSVSICYIKEFKICFNTLTTRTTLISTSCYWDCDRKVSDWHANDDESCNGSFEPT